MDVLLIVGFLTVDFLFHDLLKPGEATAAQYMTGVMSVLVLAICVRLC